MELDRILVSSVDTRCKREREKARRTELVKRPEPVHGPYRIVKAFSPCANDIDLEAITQRRGGHQIRVEMVQVVRAAKMRQDSTGWLNKLADVPGSRIGKYSLGHDVEPINQRCTSIRRIR